MAIAVQQMSPVAHLPLSLGVVRRWEGATLLDRLLLPHPAHGLSGDAGSKPWSSRFWTGIMPSTRWANGWKSAGWGRCYRRGSPGLRSMMTAWGTASLRCWRPISIRC
jgi:hypothetical protein